MTRKVLVVDDEDMLLFICRSMLEDAGYIVSIAKDCETAFKLSSSYKFDFVLADYRLPGENGYSLLKRMRESGQAADFYLISGNIRFESEIRRIDTAQIISGVFEKPVDFDLLLSTLDRA